VVDRVKNTSEVKKYQCSEMVGIGGTGEVVEDSDGGFC